LKHLYILIISLAFLSAYGQGFGEINTSGLEKQKKIEKSLDKQIRKGVKNKSISASFKKVNGDTLTYIIQHRTDPLTVKMVFNIYDSITKEKYCGLQEYFFDCSPCGQKHLKEMKQYTGFIQTSDSTFISAPYLQTEMQITNRNGFKDCLIIKFKHIDMPYKEYKEHYRKLKKKTTSLE